MICATELTIDFWNAACCAGGTFSICIALTISPESTDFVTRPSISFAFAGIPMPVLTAARFWFVTAQITGGASSSHCEKSYISIVFPCSSKNLIASLPAVTVKPAFSHCAAVAMNDASGFCVKNSSAIDAGCLNTRP